jgi:hypothetical protein
MFRPHGERLFSKATGERKKKEEQKRGAEALDQAIGHQGSFGGLNASD